MIVTLLSVTAIFAAAGVVFAAEHGMSHGGMAGMDHGKMNQEQKNDMMTGMMPLGHMTVDDVKATAQIKDVREAMKGHGMAETHHVMVSFAGAASGHPVTGGTVAVRVTAPSGKTTEPKAMMGMDGAFGADVVLAEKGKYTIEVACKLEDGKKRQFQFHHQVK